MVPALLPEPKGVNELSELLEVVAHGVTAVLATWLGLLVLTRARRAPGAPVFSFLCLLLVSWSIAIIVQRVGTLDSVKPAMNLLEDAAAFLLPPATTHIAISVAFEGRRSPLAGFVLAAGYTLGIAAIVQAWLDPAHPIQFPEPNWEPFGVSGDVVAWIFALARLTVWLAGIAYLLLALRESGPDRARRRQLTVAIATVLLGVIGAMLRILPAEIGGPLWLGVSVVAVATVLASYAIIAQHIFIAADVAGRAVRWSMIAGLGIVAYVAVLVLLEPAVGRLLGVDFPIVSALAVVVTLALFDPISERVRSISAGSPLAAAQDRLLQALGVDAITAQDPDRAVGPGLDRLVRTFELTGARVVIGGETVATSGTLDADEPLGVRLSMGEAATPFGHAVFGRKRDGSAYTPADLEALQLAVDFLAASLRLAERRDEQATALVELRAEGVAVESQGTALSAALADATSRPAGLHVYALGSLRAEMNGEPMRRWGGEKAGSRQAEGIFAFLFDRRDQGVAKDEILELVWPDVDLDRADVAFHRTMLGLRSALTPGRRRRGSAGPISFGNDRYRLDPSAVAWSDVAEFERLLAEAARADPDESLRLFEQARALYRGEYLDDCPFYGDSAAAEDRRGELRQRYVDLLVELGERYAARAERTAAASCLRQAQALADDEMPRIIEALDRLTLPAPAEPA